MSENENLNEEKKPSFLSKIDDKYKVGFFRWWFTGAIYFFIAWGTNLGLKSDPFDLVFFLGLAEGIGMLIIFNPVVYGMFDIKRNGKIVNKKYYERSILENVIYRLAEIFKCMFVTLLVFMTYVLINLAIVNMIGNKSEIPVKGEPLLFATFFVIYYWILTFVNSKIALLVKKLMKKDDTL